MWEALLSILVYYILTNFWRHEREHGNEDVEDFDDEDVEEPGWLQSIVVLPLLYIVGNYLLQQSPLTDLDIRLSVPSFSLPSLTVDGMIRTDLLVSIHHILYFYVVLQDLPFLHEDIILAFHRRIRRTFLERLGRVGRLRLV